MLTHADRANLEHVTRGAMPRSADFDDNMGMDWISLATTAATIAQSIGLGVDPKKDFKEFTKASQQVIGQTGTDIVTGATALKLDPYYAAQAASEYLAKDYGTKLSAQQIIALSPAANTDVVSQIAGNPLYLAAGAGGLLLLVLLMRS